MTAVEQQKQLEALKVELANIKKTRFESESGRTHWEGCWRDHYQCAMRRIEELEERNRMEADIALSALALKMNIENGFPPRLDALNRDLAAFQRRFGDVAQVVEHATDNREVGSSSDSITTKSKRKQ